MPEPSFQNLTPEALALLRRHNLLTALIRAETVAEAVGPEPLPQDQCDQLWNGYLGKHKIENDEQLASHLQTLGLDADALHWQLELPLRIQQHSQEQFQHKAEARFLAKKEQLDKVVYSLLRVRDGYLARELYLRIAGQEANFADLAAEHSQGPEAKTKGIVGPAPQPGPSGPQRTAAHQPTGAIAGTLPHRRLGLATWPSATRQPASMRAWHNGWPRNCFRSGFKSVLCKIRRLT